MLLFVLISIFSFSLFFFSYCSYFIRYVQVFFSFSPFFLLLRKSTQLTNSSTGIKKKKKKKKKKKIHESINKHIDKTQPQNQPIYISFFFYIYRLTPTHPLIINQLLHTLLSSIFLKLLHTSGMNHSSTNTLSAAGKEVIRLWGFVESTPR